MERRIGDRTLLGEGRSTGDTEQGLFQGREDYAKDVLLLFYPFTSLNDFVCLDATVLPCYWNKLLEVEPTFSARDLAVLANFQEYYNILASMRANRCAGALVTEDELEEEVGAENATRDVEEAACIDASFSPLLLVTETEDAFQQLTTESAASSLTISEVSVAGNVLESWQAKVLGYCVSFLSLLSFALLVSLLVMQL